MTYRNRLLYHMTSMKQAPSVLFWGIQSRECFRKTAGEEAGTVLGDSKIIERRGRINLALNGEQVSLNTFAPLYWATHTPMQHIQTVKKRTVKNEDLVFIVLKASTLAEASGLEIKTSDGNAAHSQTKFYDGWEAYEHLEWKILNSKRCLSPEYIRKKMAEVLVHRRIPPDLVDHVSVYAHSSKSRLEQGFTNYKTEQLDWLKQQCQEIDFGDPNTGMIQEYCQKQIHRLEQIEPLIQVRPNMYCL